MTTNSSVHTSWVAHHTSARVVRLLTTLLLMHCRPVAPTTASDHPTCNRHTNTAPYLLVPVVLVGSHSRDYYSAGTALKPKLVGAKRPYQLSLRQPRQLITPIQSHRPRCGSPLLLLTPVVVPQALSRCYSHQYYYSSIPTNHRRGTCILVGIPPREPHSYPNPTL